MSKTKFEFEHDYGVASIARGMLAELMAMVARSKGQRVTDELDLYSPHESV